MNNVSNKIKSRREQLNFSQEYIAEHLGISQPAYVKIEKGITKLDFERLIKISEILQIDINELLEKQYIVNNFKNSDSSTAIGMVENLHQENHKTNELLIQTLFSQISDLKEENKRLISIVEKLSSNKK
ncbi:helix-turn-helix domain-containing protein [Flavobacterium sp.]|uniref:helix-turn-helix domain-containing protein n=1 Tax=Flavobacterium sp. TaxID=239 RepID=UPI0040473E1F